MNTWDSDCQTIKLSEEQWVAEASKPDKRIRQRKSAVKTSKDYLKKY
jgi:hypothetical protein